jgi:hypothetical protein
MKRLLLYSKRINLRGETIHFCLPLEAHSRWPCISPTDSDNINKLALPIKHHPFLVNHKRGVVRWQVDEMMPSQKRFPLVYNNHKVLDLLVCQVCSNKKSLVVILFHAKSFGQMKYMVEAGIDTVPVRWRFRQQQEEFRYLVQNV